MKRGAEGDREAPDRDSFTVVRDFMDRMGNREPTAEELLTLRPALEELYEKLLRLRRMTAAFRSVDFSDSVWRLMKLIGKKPKPAPRSTLGRAASFL